MSLTDIATVVSINYSSVRTIISNYKKTGRTNKLLTYLTKRAILKGRKEERVILEQFSEQKQMDNSNDSIITGAIMNDASSKIRNIFSSIKSIRTQKNTENGSVAESDCYTSEDDNEDTIFESDKSKGTSENSFKKCSLCLYQVDST